MGASGSADMASTSPYWENKDYILKLMMNYCGITEDDLHKNSDVVKQKVRQAGINFVLEGE